MNETPKLSITQAAEAMRDQALELKLRLIGMPRQNDTPLRKASIQLVTVACDSILNSHQVMKLGLDEINRIDFEGEMGLKG